VLSPDYILNILKTECGYNDDDSILVGVSGGADSVALLHLLHAAKVPVAAAHVNYGLRGEESDGDEQFVSELCGKLNVPLYTRRVNKERMESVTNNLQAGARHFRYEFFKEIVRKESMSWIAVAHNSDDQLETVLINFLRGSGITGLSGMKSLNRNIIRPLLHISRTQIELYCSAHGILWRNDSSNETDDYLRNRVRHHVIPPMKNVDERDSIGWKKSIENLQVSSSLIESLMKPWVERATIPHVHAVHFDKKVLSEFPVPHLLLNYLLDQDGIGVNFTEEQFERMMKQQPGRNYVFSGLRLVVDRDVLILHGDHPEPWYPFALLPGNKHEGWSCTRVTPASPEKFCGFEALINSDLINDNLVVRKWEIADKIQPFGFNGTKNVSDVLTEMKLPLNEKERFPVVTYEKDIVWIPGYRIAEKYKVTPETKTALHIKWNR
jgi:tRNA(Ile)-lysidine synthase